MPRVFEGVERVEACGKRGTPFRVHTATVIERALGVFLTGSGRATRRAICQVRLLSASSLSAVGPQPAAGG